jgi:hypothetical protein
MLLKTKKEFPCYITKLCLLPFRSDGTQNEIGNFAGKKHSLVTLEPFEVLLL